MESRGIVFTNMMRYFDADNSQLMPMDALEAMAFNVVKINVDDSFSEYADRQRVNQANGLKGGRPAKTEEDPNNPVGNKITEITRVQKREERRKKEEDRSGTGADRPPRARFSPPSFEEVLAYCRERANGIDAHRFLDYYTANGWVQGRGKPIKDWKAAVRTWERNNTSGQQDAGTANLDWRQEGPSVLWDDLVEDPPGSGKYRPRWEVSASG